MCLSYPRKKKSKVEIQQKKILLWTGITLLDSQSKDGYVITVLLCTCFGFFSFLFCSWWFALWCCRYMILFLVNGRFGSHLIYQRPLHNVSHDLSHTCVIVVFSTTTQTLSTPFTHVRTHACTHTHTHIHMLLSLSLPDMHLTLQLVWLKRLFCSQK